MKLEITLWEIINEQIHIHRSTHLGHRKMLATARSRNRNRSSLKSRRSPLRPEVLPLCYDI